MEMSSREREGRPENEHAPQHTANPDPNISFFDEIPDLTAETFLVPMFIMLLRTVLLYQVSYVPTKNVRFARL